MKLACYRPRVDRGTGVRLLLLVIGLLALSMVLASCKQTQRQAEPEEVAHITSEPAQSIPGRAVQKSMGVECQNNLQQLRMLIDTAHNENEDGSYPESLNSMPEAARISTCPISHQPYTYDPSTGQVHCTFQGHEGF